MDTQTSFAPRAGGQRLPELEPSTGTKKASSRKRSTIVLLVLVTLIGALGGAVVVARAGDRVDVLAIARDVPAGQKLSGQDVRSVSFAEDPGLSPVPASQRSAVIGQRASVDLRRGSLLTRAQLNAGGALGDSRQVVGVEVKRGFAPAGELRPGDTVAAVILPPQGGQPTGADSGTQDSDSKVPDTIAATVKSAGTPDATGSVVVNLVVAPQDGPLLAAKAAAKQVALVRQPREKGN
ncbi:SAF domain-containing protein [Streptomyces sp. NPDC004528]|uniref:SAF domain-containing protein n=1 Tax=Streptomyces sp. NPDC004528 TaxID=3154550 RepID=UPI0033B79A1D